MSSCKTWINLDEKRSTFRSGETISGQLHVVPDKKVKARQILIESCWYTHGRGNKNTGVVESYNFDEMILDAGEDYIFPFEFTASSHPVTYRGHYLNIDHLIRARVDVPWAFDPKAQVEYVLKPGDEPSKVPHNHVASSLSADGSSGCGGKIGLGIFLLVALIITFAIPFPFGFIVTPILLLVFLKPLRNMVAQMKTGKLKIEVEDNVVEPGSQVPIRIELKPSKSMKITQINCQVQAREVVVSGSGTNKTTHRHTIYSSKSILTKEREVEGGRPHSITGSISIPDKPLYSFHASDNKLLWTVKVHLDIPGWPDFSKELGFVVVANAGQEPVEQPSQSDKPQAKRAVPTLPVLGEHEMAPPLAPDKAIDQASVAESEEITEVVKARLSHVREVLDQRVEAEEDFSPAPPRPAALEESLSSSDDATSHLSFNSPAPVEESDHEVIPESETPERRSSILKLDDPEESVLPSPPVSEDVSLEPAAVLPEIVAKPLVPDTDAGDKTALDQLLKEIESADRFSGERDALMSESVGKPFVLEVDLQRLDRSYGSHISDAYQNGRTVSVFCSGTRIPAALLFPPSDTEKLEQDKKRAGLSVFARFVRYDSVRRQLELEVVSADFGGGA